ncbi:uncharacterized protein LOC117337912 [Pecten maximus]|uniref:uncharacterized protein LOC117337912 n=1 Tax=Pecten maximus TaxID=6579 RepID=UPI0014583D68|nr:uncharacterized protein LOC117337912 [Pecten maximus]
MSPLVLLLVLIAGSISASKIRDYTGGNSIEDVFEHQDSAGPGSEEITNIPADNIDSEVITDTDIDTEQANMQCNAFYTCAMQNPPPAPLGSITKGFYISPGFLKKICRYMKTSVACYYQGEYADCPIVTGNVKTMTNMYRYMCVEPGRSAVLSMLPCINNYEVQFQLILSSYGWSHSVKTIMDWPDQEPSNIALMMCRATRNFYYDTGSEIEHQCSAVDRRVYEHMIVVWSRFDLRRFNCTLEENNNTSL